MTDDNCGFGNIAYLPSGKTNTCENKEINRIEYITDRTKLLLVVL